MRKLLFSFLSVCSREGGKFWVLVSDWGDGYSFSFKFSQNLEIFALSSRLGNVLPKAKCHQPLVTHQYIGAGTDNHLSHMYWCCKHIKNQRNPNFVALCSHVIAYWYNWQYPANILVLQTQGQKKANVLAFWISKVQPCLQNINFSTEHCLFIQLERAEMEICFFFNIAVRLKNKGTSAANVRDHNLTLAMFPVPLTFHWSPTLSKIHLLPCPLPVERAWSSPKYDVVR